MGSKCEAWRFGVCKSRQLPFVFLTVAILFVAAGCGGDGDDSGSADQGASPESAAPTATVVATDPSPSPTEEATLPCVADGVPLVLTFEEAQARFDFELVMPDPIPPSMEFDALVSIPPVPPPLSGTPDSSGTCLAGAPTMAHFGFLPVSGAAQPVTLTESSKEIGLGSSGGDDTFTIDGVEITKATRDQPSGTLLIYYWEAQGLHFSMHAIVGPGLRITEEDLQQLIAGTLG